MQTDNLRIGRTRALISPAVLQEEIELSPAAQQCVSVAREQIRAALFGDDARLMVVVGPCSIHDLTAAMEYAERLRTVSDEVSEQLLIVMRVYFEKPRTTVGWKGLINDPDLDGSFRINTGLRLARQLLRDIAELGLPAATEFLDTTLGQYYTDLVSWGAIGARTAESQIHRQLASGLSMPVGIKNRTDGDVQVAIDGVLAASHAHLFPTLTKEGAPAIVETTGNADCHVVLRGGSEPNFDAAALEVVAQRLDAAGLPRTIAVDCSHANSQKQPRRQPEIAEHAAACRAFGVRALMLESHLIEGRQDLGGHLNYGQSITDACLGFDDTRALLLRLAEQRAG